LLDELGLIPALRSHLENLAQRTGLRVFLRADPLAEQLSDEEKLVLFRVAQESLNNVVKHAKASRAEVAVWKTGEGIEMSVADNGKSFRLDVNGAVRHQRLGLLGMRERVRLVNGIFRILPRPGRGTTVRVTIPFKPAGPLPAASEAEAPTD
jgi:signal transduction histidine kinase